MKTDSNSYEKPDKRLQKKVNARLRNLSEEVLQIRKEIEFFSSAINYGILSGSCAVDYENMKKKKMEEFVSKVHTRSIYSKEFTRKNGQSYTLWITKLDRDTRMTASTREELIGKLYSYYSHEEETILSTVFVNFLNSKSRENISGKSLQEYKRLWTKFYENEPIACRKITDISVKEWKEFFADICIKNKLTKNQFKQARIVIFGMMTYCVDEGILEVNSLRDINYRKLPYTDEPAYNNVKARSFTDQEIGKVAEWCREELKKPNIKPVYPLAILFNLNAGLRFAEMSGLKWEHVDFDNKLITITGQAVLDIKMNKDQTFTNGGRKRVEHVKSHEAPRIIPIGDGAIQILEEIRKLKMSDEYVFPNGNFRYHTYNSKIKLAAEAIGLDPKDFHTHCLRSTVATNTYNSCLDIKQVQMLLGHTTPEMTSKYIKDWRGIDVLRKTLSQIPEVGL